MSSRTRPESGKLVVISGPSGVGKSTITRQVLGRTAVAFSVSVTTRQVRRGEVDGKDYHFVSREAFEKMIAANCLLEWADVFGNLYGTPAEPVHRAIESGDVILLEIDVQGGLQVHEKMPEATFVLVVPPDMDELQRRLKLRNTEDAQAFQRRCSKAREELKIARESGVYDMEVVNDDLETATGEVVDIINI